MKTRYLGRQSFCDYLNDLANDTYFEINGQMIGLLPKFRGVNRDNPFTHLRDLHLVCNTLRNRYVAEEDFMLRMLPYSLVSDAKSWMFSLYVDSRLTWDQMRQLFLKEYSVKQYSNETTHEYFERFKDSLDTCLDYSFPEHVLIISFLDGMSSYEREMMDLMAKGSILDCYPEDVWELIHKRAKQTKPIEFSDLAYIEQEEERRRFEQLQMTMDIIAELNEQQPAPQSSAQLEEQAEAQVSAQPEVCRESEPDPNTTMEQGIIRYIPNLLLVPNFILSSQIQEDKHKTENEEKI